LIAAATVFWVQHHPWSKRQVLRQVLLYTSMLKRFLSRFNALSAIALSFLKARRSRAEVWLAISEFTTTLLSHYNRAEKSISQSLKNDEIFVLSTDLSDAH
jgi:hypothetical protein